MDFKEFDRKKRMVEADLKDLRFPEGISTFQAVIFPDNFIWKADKDAPGLCEGPVILEYWKVNGKWEFKNYK